MTPEIFNTFIDKSYDLIKDLQKQLLFAHSQIEHLTKQIENAKLINKEEPEKELLLEKK